MRHYKFAFAMFSMLMVGALVSSAVAQDGERGPRGPRGEGQGERGPRGEGQGRGGRQFDPEAFVERVMQLDKDKDGKVSKDELGDSRISGMFERADADKDGFLTKEELSSMMQRRPQGQGGPGQRGARGPRFLPSMQGIELSEEQRGKVRELEAEIREKLMSILTEEQREQLMTNMRNANRPEAGQRGEGRGPGPGARGGDGEGRGNRGPRDGEGRGPRGPRDGDA